LDEESIPSMPFILSRRNREGGRRFVLFVSNFESEAEFGISRDAKQYRACYDISIMLVK